MRSRLKPITTNKNQDCKLKKNVILTPNDSTSKLCLNACNFTKIIPENSESKKSFSNFHFFLNLNFCKINLITFSIKFSNCTFQSLQNHFLGYSGINCIMEIKQF